MIMMKYFQSILLKFEFFHADLHHQHHFLLVDLCCLGLEDTPERPLKDEEVVSQHLKSRGKENCNKACNQQSKTVSEGLIFSVQSPYALLKQ